MPLFPFIFYCAEALLFVKAGLLYLRAHHRGTETQRTHRGLEEIAIEEMVRIYELRELEERIRKTSQKIATRHPMSISDAVLSARAEEDEELLENWRSAPSIRLYL